MNEPDDILWDTLKHTLDRHAQALQPEQMRRLRDMRRQVLSAQRRRPWLVLRWASGGLAVACMTLLLASGSGQTWTSALTPVAQKRVDPQMLDDMSMLMVIGEDTHAS